jgi:PAS domain S-box-containing protein
MIRQGNEAIEYTYLEKRKVAGICSIPITGWSIAVTQEKSEIMSLAFANMNFLLIVSSLFVILIILAVLFFSKTISAPVQTTLNTLNHAIDQAAEAFFIISRDGNVRFANPAAVTIIGRSLQDIIDKPFLNGDEASNYHSEIMNSLEEKNIWNGRIDGARQDGSAYTMALTLTPVMSATGKLMYYLAVGRDITEELVLHQQLQQSQKMEAIGTLAGGIAHDFNNILSAIFGYTELSLDSLEDEKALESYLAQVLEASKRARDLVSHILTFSRKADLGKKPMVPKYIITETLQLLRASLPTTIEIRDSLNSTAAIMGNDTQVHQMVMNICSNAGYEMEKEGGLLSITLEETTVNAEIQHQHPDLHPGKYLRLIISDTGGGIPDDVLDRIFDPFFTTKPTGKGTGMGLAVVHGIVKSLGGEIMVNSQEGVGSTFTILLPIYDTMTVPPNETERKKLPPGTERILLVDDEKAITHSMQTLLEGLGYRVQVFNRSSSALEEFMAHPDHFDIVITDYTMPKMTGDALAREIRRVRPQIPLILCSGYMAAKDKLDELLPIEFLKKPVTAQQLSNAVRQALDKS